MTDVFARRPEGEPGLRFYAEGVPSSLTVPAVPLPALLDDAARRFGARTALSHDGRWTGFRALRRSVVRVAGALERLGVRRGTWVLALLPDCPELVVLSQAVWRVGAVLVPWDPADHRAAEAAVAGRAGPLAVVVPHDMGAEVAGAWGCELLVTVDVARPRPPSRSAPGDAAARPRVKRQPSPVVVRWRDLARRGAERLPAAWERPWARGPEPDDIAVVRYGRTGAPIALCHRHLVAAAHQLACWYPELSRRRGRLLSLAPLWTLQGLVLVTLAAPLVGARAVLVTDPAPATVLRAARRTAPTVLAAPPAALAGLLGRPAHEREALGTVRAVLTAPLDAETGQRVREACGARLVEGFGPAAACGVALANPPTADARSGTAGLALPGTRVRIAVEGALSADALPGHAGELLLRGPQVSRVRVGGVEDVLPGGWLRTGRIAVRGPDGFVTLVRDGPARPRRGGDASGGGPDGGARRG
ncbi:AMP-binding protein [Streptomyces sp. NPDC088785]|uniref:AMP-binding protein n=1 Tax=Streptomyces sp. NPDC088785 TaxID=3365897 RepID=UPI003822D900